MSTHPDNHISEPFLLAFTGPNVLIWIYGSTPQTAFQNFLDECDFGEISSILQVHYLAENRQFLPLNFA